VWLRVGTWRQPSQAPTAGNALHIRPFLVASTPNWVGDELPARAEKGLAVAYRVHLRGSLCSFCVVAVVSNGLWQLSVCNSSSRQFAAKHALSKCRQARIEMLDSAAAERLYRSGVRDAATMQLRRARRLGHNFGRGAATGEKIEVAGPTLRFSAPTLITAARNLHFASLRTRSFCSKTAFPVVFTR